ncbi:MAG: AmmeMemoRadiSam system protein B [Nitrospiraceae bacterium]|nr:AmmeMemoRadiSam system protein B [Nitrospiraceae bacterium]
MAKRSPAVAGQFYYGNRERLLEQVGGCVVGDARKEEAIGIIVPHAGFIYSGPVAGAVYSTIRFPKTFVLLGPNHTGLGSAISLSDDLEWETPLGPVEVDKKLAAKIVQNDPGVTRDNQAHLFEHSLEVQLPFISYFSKDVKIVPIALLSASLSDCVELGRAIARAVRSVDYPVVIAASSDMSHYVAEKTARQKDQKAIDRVLAVDPEGLYETVVRERISMCGYMPATAMLSAARELGANSGRLVRYATSGDVSGDFDSVVGYAGIAVR